ncbi:MAG: hypothetical protein HY334_06205, partial [Armatimonadetes bacterium]|nr:hypothetical protein [Armatimonadota bacterium]
VAPQHAARERLTGLKARFAADAAELRGRWRATRMRVPQEWRQVRSTGRDVLEMLWLLLRRRADSTTPPGGPSSG